ncbi:MAG: hypothetical protein AAF942_07685 [Pseudomonadota bacterium]
MHGTDSDRLPAGWQGNFIGFVAIGLVSGALSAAIGGAAAEAAASTYIALIPGVIYGVLTAGYAWFRRLVVTRTAVLFVVAVLFIWGAAVHLAPVTCGDWLYGSGFLCSLLAAGLVGGGIGAAALALFSAFLVPEFRTPGAVIAMIGAGIVGGGFLAFGNFAMFCIWQGGMNAVLGFVLSRRSAPVSTP